MKGIIILFFLSTSLSSFAIAKDRLVKEVVLENKISKITECKMQILAVGTGDHCPRIRVAYGFKIFRAIKKLVVTSKNEYKSETTDIEEKIYQAGSPVCSSSSIEEDERKEAQEICENHRKDFIN